MTKTLAQVNTLAFFDSGQGGLTIWSHIRRSFPNLKTIYLGDNARYPFGTKSAATVRRYTTEAILALTELGADAIVVACGTASSVAVPNLTSLFSIPIIGIVEGMCDQALLAIETLVSKENLNPHHTDDINMPCGVAILGTHYTVKSERFLTIIKNNPRHSKSNKCNIQFWSRACPLFVPLVEEGLHESSLAREAVSHYLSDVPLDTRVVILGCTHFPRLIPAISEFLENKLGRKVVVYSKASAFKEPDAVYLIDPALAVEADLRAGFLFTSHNNQTETGSALADSHLAQVYCTDDPESFERTARIFCPDILPPIQKKTISL